MSETAKERFFRILSLYQAGHLLEAEEALRAPLRTAPKDPNLLHLAAQIAERQGDKPRAATFYRRAIAALPGWLEATYNLARLLHTMPEAQAKEEAIALLLALAKAHPQRAEIWEALARFEQAAQLLPDAVAHWREALALKPNNPEGRGQYLFACRALCDWRENPKPDSSLAPQITATLFDDPAALKESAQLFVARRFSSIQRLPPAPGWSHPRLRIGYLSSDFHAHATSWLMAELFALHDRKRFEVFIYSYGIEDHSAIRARLRREAEHFVELNELTPAECAQKIRADEIDILIDLKGHTHGARLDILAYRPAPVQAHWLGFPGTTGANFIDYFVADPTTVPPSAEQFFTETIIRLPHTYQINDRQKRIGPPQSRATYGLPEGALVLASFNQSYKITPEVFDIWCEILRELPDAVLWLYESNAFMPDYLRREAVARGVDPSRLYFAKPLSLEEHLARYQVVDLVIDTFPVGGHTTTSDALWVGMPVVTLTGQCFASRVAASLLRAAELPLLVTNTPEEYRQRILDLAHNKAARESIRAHLLGKREGLPLFDTPAFVQAWEGLLQNMARKA